MLLDFKAVKDGRSTQFFRLGAEDSLLEGFFGNLTRELDVTARIVEQPHRMFVVTLRVEGELESPCRRCLSATRQAVDERTMLLFEVGTATRGDAYPEQEVLPLRSPQDRVDIGPAVREALFLAAEVFPLCSSECRGLCPDCGEDLNVSECRCQPHAADPHWRGLLELGS